MNKFSETSEIRLSTCDPQLILLAHYAIKESPYDFMITHGHRSPAMQFDLYKKGREYIDSKWVVTDPKKVVTSRDGNHIKSKHNFIPSKAFDIAVLVNGQVTWDPKYYEEVAEHILKIAHDLHTEGMIASPIRWGGHFSNYDGPHYELI